MSRGWARCQGVACSQAQACWRFRAPPQRYEASANYWQTRGEVCTFFEPMDSGHWATLMAPPIDEAPAD